MKKIRFAFASIVRKFILQAVPMLCFAAHDARTDIMYIRQGRKIRTKKCTKLFKIKWFCANRKTFAISVDKTRI